MTKHRNLKASLFTPLLMMLAACGSGGGGDGGDDGGSSSAPTPPLPPAEPVEISAVVSGTTVLVVDERGAIIAMDNTDDRQPDSDTDNDGSADSYSIALTDLPLNAPIRVFLISAGNIVPLVFGSGPESTEAANVFRFASRGKLDLGIVKIEDGESKIAVAEFDPSDNELITGTTRVEGLPTGINQPPTTGLSLAELNQRCLAALRDGWLGGAKSYSAAAVALAANTVSSEADLARVTAALARVAAALSDTPSDGDFAQLRRLGDLLDAFGVANDGRRGSAQSLDVPETLPVNSPKGDHVRDFAYDVLATELLAATQLLDATSSSFEFELSETGDTITEIDHGEILAIQAVFSAALASIATLAAHNLDADIDEAVATQPTVETLLAENPGLLMLSQAERLGPARSAWISALDALDAAILWMSTETDDQSDDLITLDEQVAEDIEQVRELLENLRSSLTNGATVIEPALELNLAKFFDGDVDLRAASLLPTFAGNDPVDYTTCFPDPTFGGVVLSPDLNRDDNANSVCDLLE